MPEMRRTLRDARHDGGALSAPKKFCPDECRVPCEGCGCTIHLDDEDDWPLCEECASDEYEKEMAMKDQLPLPFIRKQVAEDVWPL
jgi:hypothetical protein